jgi:hypothetical protein
MRFSKVKVHNENAFDVVASDGSCHGQKALSQSQQNVRLLIAAALGYVPNDLGSHRLAECK